MAEPVYLLDTNICIYVLTDGAGSAARRLERCLPGTAVVSAITYAEVLRGIPAAETAALATVGRLFAVVPVLPFDAMAAETFPRLPFRRGRFDHLIAAHALALGLCLVTNNERDFANIPGLAIENWTL